MSPEHQTIIDATAMAALASNPADGHGRYKVIFATGLHYAAALQASHPYMPVEEVHGNAVSLVAAVVHREKKIEVFGGVLIEMHIQESMQC